MVNEDSPVSMRRETRSPDRQLQSLQRTQNPSPEDRHYSSTSRESPSARRPTAEPKESPGALLQRKRRTSVEVGQKSDKQQLSQVSFESAGGASRDSDDSGKTGWEADVGRISMAGVGNDKRISWLESRTRAAIGMSAVDAVKRLVRIAFF
jgi:hypothetical protein